MSSQGAQSHQVLPQETITANESDVKHLTRIIQARRSVRQYTDKPIPKELLEEALAIAQMAPSNSNTQVWRLYIATGRRRELLGEAMTAAASAGPPTRDIELPEALRQYRSELGRELYGKAYGIDRSDTDARRAAVMRNFNFFEAPVGIVVTMDKGLQDWDAMSVGLYLQTLSLILTAKGLGMCLDVCIAGYPEVCREQLDIPENETVLCGIALGWPDLESEQGQNINTFKRERDYFDKNVKFYD